MTSTTLQIPVEIPTELFTAEVIDQYGGVEELMSVLESLSRKLQCVQED